MGAPVHLKRSSFSTLVAALIATEGLLSTVNEHVLIQAISSCASITTLVTVEGLLFIVREHVPLQGTSLSAFLRLLAVVQKWQF